MTQADARREDRLRQDGIIGGRYGDHEVTAAIVDGWEFKVDGWSDRTFTSFDEACQFARTKGLARRNVWSRRTEVE